MLKVNDYEDGYMKVSVVKNDKSTALDEIILSIITAVILVAGIMLVVYRPTLNIDDGTLTTCFGIIMILLSVMYIPCIIYRFFTNDKNK